MKTYSRLLIMIFIMPFQVVSLSTSFNQILANSCEKSGSLNGSGGGVIAFYSERDGNAEIYVMNADGTGLTNISNNPADDITPDISRNGAKIVFISDRHGNREIYTMNTDGSNLNRLTNNSTIEAYPYFSSDGTKIIYSSNVDGNYDVFIMDSNGSSQTRITNTTTNEEWAHLSPDKLRIVYGTGNFPNIDIYRMDSNGQNVVPMITLSNLQAFPKWSPDGNTIAYNYGVFVGGFSVWFGDIYLMDSNGSNQRRITDSDSSCFNEDPYWSPDGDRIVFQSNRTGNFQIYTMHADGSNQTRITNHTGNDYWPSWGRDTTQVNINDYDKTRHGFQLRKNYPNPFNPSTTIEFEIPMQGHVTLKIYNILGQEVATLLNRQMSRGNHIVQWNSGSVSSGVYLYRLTFNDISQTNKLIITR